MNELSEARRNRRRIPDHLRHSMYDPDPMPQRTVPISLALTIQHVVIGTNKFACGTASYVDEMRWNLNATQEDRRQFIDQTITDMNHQDSHMDVNLWERTLTDQFERKVAEAVANNEHQPMETTPDSAQRDLVPIHIDLVDKDSEIRLQDSLLWSPSNRHADPDEFANSYTRDLSLPAGFSVKIAQTIREQLAQHAISGTASSSVPVDSDASVIRSVESSNNFAPNIRGLTVRGRIAITQHPPPPYVAHYTPAMHRHELVAGEVLDASTVLAEATAAKAAEEVKVVNAPPNADAIRAIEAFMYPKTCKTRTVYSHRCSSENFLLLRKQRVDVSPDTDAPATSAASTAASASASVDTDMADEPPSMVIRIPKSRLSTPPAASPSASSLEGLSKSPFTIHLPNPRKRHHSHVDSSPPSPSLLSMIDPSTETDQIDSGIVEEGDEDEEMEM